MGMASPITASCCRSTPMAMASPKRRETRSGILRGDFGNSFFQNRPVLDIVLARIPATLRTGRDGADA